VKTLQWLLHIANWALRFVKRVVPVNFCNLVAG
jgi:hypothetical protein